MSPCPSLGRRYRLQPGCRNGGPFWLLLSIVIGVFGCSGKDQARNASGQPSASSEPLPPLPTRAEGVARADVLAVDGAKKGGADGARLTLEAAELRRRIWRVEGTNADALEAVELFRAASRVAWQGACGAEIEQARLEGELALDPAAEYRALYTIRKRRHAEPCAARIDELLATLEAFAPPAHVLANLGREAAASASAAPAANGAGALPALAVVMPEVPSVTPSEPAEITKVQLYGGKEAGRVVVLVTRPTLFEFGELAADSRQGPRIFVDIKDTTYRGRGSIEGDGLVARVRIGAQGKATRVVLDLASRASRRVFYLPEPFRLVIDVSKDLEVLAPLEKGRPRHVRRVVLDPGHGGHDPGAQGPAGLREKDVVLDIAHRAAPLIARELGISTLLTRDADVFVPLDERVARANAFSSDLFVSIHCNASESPSNRGVMTFVLDASRDDLALRVAARENAASEEAAAELANAMSRVLDPASLVRSSHLAELLQRAAVASLTAHYPEVLDHGVRSAGFYVLAGARMPATLFEASFISNPAEERRLDMPDYRQKMADAIVNAVRAYRDGL